MIRSILDNDLYKFSQQNAFVKLYPREKAIFELFNRGNTEFPLEFDKLLKEKINDFKDLQLLSEEKDFLKEKVCYLDPTYLDFLESYKYDPTEVSIYRDKNNKLRIKIQGDYYKVMMWEVPLMATISELYFEMTNSNVLNYENVSARNCDKLSAFERLGIKYADFGTRRRYSYDNHEHLVKSARLYSKDSFVGTSNVYLGMNNNLPVIGTQAHEWFMFHAAKFGPRIANLMAMEKWVEVYQGDLGIVLTDTFTTDVFLNSFNTKYSKLFDGVRHDSGDPIKFAEKIIKHYKKLKIDPKSKTIIFSDSINNEDLIVDIRKTCMDRIKVAYGIGTWLTNDVGVKPLNIVIKLTNIWDNDHWQSTVKLSDDIGKNTGDKETIDIYKKMFGIKE